MNTTHAQILDLIDRFLSGADRSLALAGELEVALDEAYGEDDFVQDIVLRLAAYRPEGGELLYDQDTIQPYLEDLRHYLEPH